MRTSLSEVTAGPEPPRLPSAGQRGGQIGNCDPLQGFALCSEAEGSAGLGVRSFFHVMRNTRATPVQMALSATLNAGKLTSRPPR